MMLSVLPDISDVLFFQFGGNCSGVDRFFVGSPGVSALLGV